MKVVLDTCVVAEASKSRCDSRVSAWLGAREVTDLYLCVVTLLELRQAAERMRRGDRAQDAAAIEAWVERRLLPAFEGRILVIDSHVARRAGELLAAGAVDYGDALKASAALAHGAALATRDVQRFQGCGVELVNPWQGNEQDGRAGAARQEQGSR